MIPAPQPATASPTPVPLTDGCPKTHLPPNPQRFFAETIKKTCIVSLGRANIYNMDKRYFERTGEVR